MWITGTCRIVLWAKTSTRTLPFPAIYIAHVAAVIAKECLTEAREYRGGVAVLNDFGDVVINVEEPQPGMDGPTAAQM